MKMQTVGFLIIGNEILSGRTTEKNLSVLAALLAPKGLRVDEVRVVRDVPTVIAKALQEMQITHNYVLTSGGIGPTHDDVTTYGVALAFNTEVIENLEALALLEAFYDGRGLEFTTMRLAGSCLPHKIRCLTSTSSNIAAANIGRNNRI